MLIPTCPLVLAVLLPAPVQTQDAAGSRTPVPVPPVVEPAIALPTCTITIEDVSTGDCIAADSTPTLGRLYPLGSYFNIDLAGIIDPDDHGRKGAGHIDRGDGTPV